MELHADIDQMKRMLEVLGNERFEIRAIRGSSVKRGYFDDATAAAKAACDINAPTGSEQPYNVFVTFNQIKEESVPVCKNLLERGKATGKGDIERRRHLFIDIDPVKPEGTNGPASNEEHGASQELQGRIREFLAVKGWPDPLEMTSGNGSYLIYAIDLPNDAIHEGLLHDVLCAIASEVESSDAKIDTGVCDPSRIVRLAGTINRKGEATSERPYRVAELTSVPDGDALATVTKDQLEEVARLLPIDARSNHSSFRELTEVPKEEHQQRVEAVNAYLTSLGLDVEKQTEAPRWTKIELRHCTKGTMYSDGSAAVLVGRGGTIGYKCFHDKCQEVGWKEFQQHHGKYFTDPIVGLVSGLAFDDPRVLAHRHLNKWRHLDGTHTLACFLGSTYRFDASCGWIELVHNELHPWIRNTIQEAFDEYTMIDMVKASRRSVTAHLVNETYATMQSICRRVVSIKDRPPFWLDTQDLPDPSDLLVLRNGFLNIRNVVEGGGPALIPMTPRLFYQHCADFDYQPEANQPTQWLNFLGSLDQDEEWINCLQEVMGYCLWLRYDAQKYFMLIGPSRSGKGTIATVLTHLLGGAVCGPSLVDFVKDFGLEPALGTRLALVPEVTYPQRQADDIVARLKAVTGGDQISVNVKHRKMLSIKLRLKVLMQTNHFVPLPDTSGALLTRLVPLKMTKSFAGVEDETLAARLVDEYPAILNWALEGVKRLHSNGGRFTLPESSKRELEKLSEASVPLRTFLDDCCELDSKVGVHKDALFGIYRAWKERDDTDGPRIAIAHDFRTVAGQMFLRRYCRGVFGFELFGSFVAERLV